MQPIAVFENPDTLQLCVAKIPVSHSGLSALLLMQQSNKRFRPFIRSRLGQPDWLLFEEGCGVAHSVERHAIDFDEESWDWAVVFSHLDRFARVEDIVHDIMVEVWTRLPPEMRRDPEISHTDFRRLASLPHLTVLTRLMELYPANAQIQSVGCAMLLKCYDYFRDVRVDNVLAEKHLLWACRSSTVSTQSSELLCTNLRLILHVGGAFMSASMKIAGIQDCDVMSFVFDVQHNWHTDREIMLHCHEICSGELANWTIPAPRTGLCPRAPVDVITHYMQQHHDDNQYQLWGCRQLSDLVCSNSCAIVVSPESMSRIAHHIRGQHAHILSKSTAPVFDEDELYSQQQCMWTFLNAVVRSSAAVYGLYMHECGLPLLLKSLDNILVLRDVGRGTVQCSFDEEIDELCGALAFICEKDDANIDSFFAHDGLGILVHVLNYFICEESATQKPCFAVSLCLKLLCSLFHRPQRRAVMHVTRVQSGGARQMKEFCFRFPHFEQRLQTLSSYLVEALGRHQDITECTVDRYILPDVTHIMQVLRILVLQRDTMDGLTPTQLDSILVTMETLLIKVYALQQSRCCEHGGESQQHQLACVSSCDAMIRAFVDRHGEHSRVPTEALFQNYLAASNPFRNPSYRESTVSVCADTIHF